MNALADKTLKIGDSAPDLILLDTNGSAVRLCILLRDFHVVEHRRRVSITDTEIDEALWAAYQRYDKTAVTEKLFRRALTRASGRKLPEQRLIRTALKCHRHENQPLSSKGGHST